MGNLNSRPALKSDIDENSLTQMDTITCISNLGFYENEEFNNIVFQYSEFEKYSPDKTGNFEFEVNCLNVSETNKVIDDEIELQNVELKKPLKINNFCKIRIRDPDYNVYFNYLDKHKIIKIINKMDGKLDNDKLRKKLNKLVVKNKDWSLKFYLKFVDLFEYLY